MKSARLTTLRIRCTRQTIVKTETRVTRTIETETELIGSPTPVGAEVNTRLGRGKLPTWIGTIEEKSYVQNHK